MRILLLTQWFDPEAHFKGLSFAKALQQRGHSVEVLTGFPNYPGGVIFPGYRIRIWQREIMQGISVLRVPLYPSHSKNIIGRIFNFLSFSFSSAIIGTMLIKKADVAYVYHPPATIGIPALIMKYLRRMAIIYDIQDLWPDTLAATGMVAHPTLLRLVDIWCRFTYRFVDKITVISPGFKTLLIKRGVPEDKISVIYNWAHAISKAPNDSSFNEKMQGKCIILFAGNLGIAQGLDTIIDAAKIIIKKHSHVVFVFVGSGVEETRLKQRIKSEDISNVVFLDRRPPEAMGSLYERADALLVHLRDEPLFKITIPSKTQTYLAAGKPILMGVHGDAADLITKANAGIVFKPQNPLELVKAVEKFNLMSLVERKALGESGRKYYNANLCEEVGIGAFESIMKSAIDQVK
jgi:glycosyltransferase involved in cell wall biosynthesis